MYNILYASETQYIKSLQYDRDTEAIARKKAEHILGEQIQVSGLIIDSINPYLAVSPGVL